MRKKIIIAILIVLPLLTSGCFIKLKTTNTFDGGVYKTYTKGDVWEQTSLVYRLGELVENFNGLDLTTLIMDPQDSPALYVGTVDHGLYYSYNGASGWHQTLLGSGKINAITVSPKETCTVYVAIGNRVYKSTDCSRHWQYKLIETRANPDNIINDLAVDPLNPQIVYAGTSGNGLFRSDDGGYSWHAVKFFTGQVVKVLINSNNSNVIYVATKGQGLYRSDNGGLDWLPLLDQDPQKGYANILEYRSLIMDPTKENGLLYASQYGLLRSADSGNSWQKIDLLTPPNTATIYSLAINPTNENEIYYGIATTLYKTEDGGLNWITKTLPTGRAAMFLLIDPTNPQILYLGTKRVK